MSIQDWGAIGEIVGALAIIVTLIYLATQVKYARRTTIDSNRANRATGVRELNGLLITNADARAAWDKSTGPEYQRLLQDMASSMELTRDEASIVLLQGFSWSFTHWDQYRSMKSNDDEEELKNLVRGFYGENPMRALITHPSYRAFVEPEFVDWLHATIGAAEE